ncbi:MAG: M23 family metallopeptidase [Desulfuromonadales bacterium]|nr:M23 family metallopeptidase [Desulfuromonadales bacterium]
MLPRHSPHILLCFLVAALLGGGLVACTPNGIYHTVQPGQTLYQIAQTYQVDATRLARVNRVDDPRKLRAGQRLYIPGVSQPMKVPATAATVKSPAARSTVSKQTADKSGKSTVDLKKKQPEPSRNKPKRTVKTPAKPTKGLFDWPVKGEVLNGFGTRGNSSLRGIEIGVKKGTPVLAAAPGKIIYSGDAIRGYGNLIIIEHSDNYFTVYGFNQKNLVVVDDYVGKGDRIALSGEPPNGKSPRLHFEIRRGKDAVDPRFYLP